MGSNPVVSLPAVEVKTRLISPVLAAVVADGFEAGLNSSDALAARVH